MCGAGPAGLATALYLHRLGHRVVVLERFAEPRPIGSGIILQPTGQAVLHDLGLFEAIRALGTPIDRLCGTEGQGRRVVLDVRYGALPKAGRGLGIHRAALFHVLHEAVLAAGIPIRVDSDVTAAREAGDGRRSLVLAGGSETEAFDLVVDCLGAGSPLKSLSDKPGRIRTLRFGAVWASLPWRGENFDATALLQRYRAASVMVGVLPIGKAAPGGEALAAFFWSLPVEDFEAVKARGIAAWKAAVLTEWPETAVYLDNIGEFSDLTLARYAHYTMPVPVARGLAFVGDSAHSTSPQLGQGANMALLDARALYLGLQKHPDDLRAALAHYARLRRWHVRLYQLMSAMFTPFYQSDSKTLPVIRDLFVSFIARIPPAPQFLAALVAGSLLSPLRKLGLKRGPRV